MEGSKPLPSALKGYAPLVSILLLGVVIRVWGLDEQALIYDDMYGANFASDSFLRMVADIARFDIHPPVYFFQLWVWMHVYPGADFWLLLNSVVWGVLSLLSVYMVADRVYGRQVALLAALLLAVLPIHVEFSRHVRQYAFLTTALPWAWYFTRDSMGGLVPAGAESMTIIPLGYLLLVVSASIALFAPNTMEIAGYAEDPSRASPLATAGLLAARPPVVVSAGLGLLLALVLASIWRPTVFIYFNF